MAVESQTHPASTTTLRRYVVWAQLIAVLVFLELALWAPTRAIRNRWAFIATAALLIFVLADLLTARTSLKHLGLARPTLRATAAIIGIGLAAAVLLLTFAHFAGCQIPANPTWFPNLRSTWGYVLWALMQEFILQSFFFVRFEELFGSLPAVWIAATLFSLVHLPSPVLIIATLIGALFFCELFRRYRSIYPIALIHALLGITIALTVPDSLLHHMRVGIGYLRYYSR